MCSNSNSVDAEELHALSGPALLDRTRDLVEQRDRIDAELARTVRVADSKRAFAHDGQKTAASWLRGHCRLSKAAASQVVRTGRALEQLPAVEQEHAAGRLTADQVDLIAQVTSPKYVRLITAQGGTVAAIGEVLAQFAVDRSHHDLSTLVHQVLQRIDQDGPEPDPTDERFLTFARHADGSITGRFHLDPLGAQKFQAALRPTGRPTGPPATHAPPASSRPTRWSSGPTPPWPPAPPRCFAAPSPRSRSK